MEEIFINVHMFGAAQMAIGVLRDQRIALPRSATVGKLLDSICAEYPSAQPLFEGRERSLHVLILVNGLDIKRMEGLDTPLHNDDRVDIISSISGG